MKLKTLFCCFTGLAMALSLTACGNNNKAADQKKPTEAAVTTEAPAQPPASPGVVKGKVLETMDASGYTYAKLDDGSKDGVWAAGPKADLKVGEEVALKGGSVMENFTSKSLNKTFEKIIFASGFLRGDDAKADFASAVAAGGAKGMASGGSSGSIVPFKDLKITKAEGADAQTVGDVFANRQELNTKTVTVKGQVVKISKNIMGKNWLHIQDGSGDPMNNTHDLVVTSADVAAKGDIVTIKGVVASDKDFGSGYKYDAIVEEATVTVEGAATTGEKAADDTKTTEPAAK